MGQTRSLLELTQLYEQYAAALEQAKRDAPPLAGRLGLGGGPKNHPCHEAFYNGVRDWVETFTAAGPDPQTAEQALRLLLSAGARHRTEDTGAYCLAIQNHGKKLIDLLPAEACAALRQDYAAWYPAADRLPLQEQMDDLLRRRAGQRRKKKRFWF